MKAGRADTKGKGRIRSLNRKGTQTGKSATVAAGKPVEGATLICERCGAVFSRRTWRRNRGLTEAALAAAEWVVCPACEQIEGGQYFGRLLARGTYVESNEAAIRKRIDNVAARAEFTQPQHRVVSIGRADGTLEVLTTSQKLAHRIAHELKKAFGGKTTYAWSDSDGTLTATWVRQSPARSKR